MKLPLTIDVRRRTLERNTPHQVVIDAAGVEILHVLPDAGGNYAHAGAIVDAVNGAGWRIDIDNAPKYVEGQASVSFMLSVEQEGGAVQHVAEAYRDVHGNFWWAEDRDSEHRNIAHHGWTIVAWRPLPAPAPRATQGARRSGRTTRQIQGAAEGSVFVVPSMLMGDAVSIAIELCRSDVLFVTPEWINRDLWHGQTLTGLVLDHSLTDAPFANAALVAKARIVAERCCVPPGGAS